MGAQFDYILYIIYINIILTLYSPSTLLLFFSDIIGIKRFSFYILRYIMCLIYNLHCLIVLYFILPMCKVKKETDLFVDQGDPSIFLCREVIYYVFIKVRVTFYFAEEVFFNRKFSKGLQPVCPIVVLQCFFFIIFMHEKVRSTLAVPKGIVKINLHNRSTSLKQLCNLLSTKYSRT